MSEQFEVRLIECLDALDNHQSIDELLARYPDDAAALRRALAVAGALPALSLEPDTAAQAASRVAFLNQAASLSTRRAGAAGAGRLGAAGAGNIVFLRAVVMLVVLLTAGAIPVAASGGALPGDPLYAVKREVETLRLQLAPSGAEREALSGDFNQRRVQEVDDLLRQGRSAETEFEGRLEAVSAGGVMVNGLAIVFPPGVQWSTLPPVGTLVEVTVRVQGGQLILVALTPISNQAPPIATQEPTVEPGATPGPEATHEPEDEQTRQPEDKPTHEPEIKPNEDGEHTETPGGEVEPTESGGGDNNPTLEPTDEGGGGDDGGGDDGGGGDNSGKGGGGDDGGGGDGGGDSGGGDGGSGKD